MSRNIRNLSSKQGVDEGFFQQMKGAFASEFREEEAVARYAESSGFSPAVVKGTASFYDFLKSPERQQKRHICEGTACLVNGTAAHLRERFPEAGKAMCCGYCYTGSGLLQKDEQGAVEGYQGLDEGFQQPEIPVYCDVEHPILTGSVDDIQALYRAAGQTTEHMLEQLRRSQLRGRGGAGFAFSFKCQAVTEQEDGEKYVVCNADEGDPGAFSDRYLLEEQPHKVLAGMYCAARITGASNAVLYIRYEYPKSIQRIAAAIAQYQQLPEALTRHCRFEIVEGKGSYVCGEETALINSIEGLRPEVRVRPPYPAQYGLWGKPTLLSNVETFANVPWILQHGGDAFAAIGSGESKGTKLVSLDSQFTHPGVYEVPCGYPFGDLVYNLAGGFKAPVKALQVGGPLGSIIPLQSIDGLTLDFETFQQAGFALGHAGIIAIPEHFSMRRFMVHILDYMAEESCGKCNPCRLGTAKGAQMLAEATPEEPLSRSLFDELLELLENGSLCALGGGVPLPMRNALTHFSDELDPCFCD